MKLVTVSEMQAIERQADASGHTYSQMMEHAGSGLAAVVAKECAGLKDGGILGLVGSGNNGGDTLVALAILAEQGWQATAFLVRSRLIDDPLIQRLEKIGGRIFRQTENATYTQLASLISENAVILDGVLGTGIQLPLKPELAEIFSFIRNNIQNLKSQPFIVAVDCPSGIDCDTGAAASQSIPANLTVTMAAVKQGLLKLPAYELIGTLRVVGIGLPAEGTKLPAWQAIQRFVPDHDWVRQVLPPRPLSAHKGTFGTALIIAGSLPYTGAVLLAGEAAYRAGAGLVTLAVPEPLHTALAGHLTAATWLSLPQEAGFIVAEAADDIAKNLERPTALLIGPGLGVEDTTYQFVARLLSDPIPTTMGFIQTTAASRIKLPPLVVDADGLKLMARLPRWHEFVPPETILTPHPGEMSILTGLSTSEIQGDRLGSAERYSREWGHIVILKGAFTIIAAPDGRTAVIPVATPALARAGTGDVLAGLIVGLRAQGVPGFEAAVAGAWIHAQAGLHALEQVGNSASVLAGDVLKATIHIINKLSR